MRSRVSDEALQLPISFGLPNATSNLSRFLHKLELCTGENAEVLHDHLKQSELKVKGFGVDPNSKEVVKAVVSSFAGSWAIGLPATRTRFSKTTPLTH